MVEALVLIGAPGSGKTSVLEAVATLHDIEDVEHGAIEAEQLSLGRPLLPASSWVPQLGAVLSLQREAGRRRFLVSATVETAEDLAAVRTATAAAMLLVVCLSASSETVAARIDAREPDRWPGKAPLIDRARQLASSTPPPAGYRPGHQHRAAGRGGRGNRDPSGNAAQGDARISLARGRRHEGVAW